MKIGYGVTGKNRKALVTAIAEITGADAIYKGVPTCSYEVDYFTIDKSGTLIFDDSADSEETEHLIEELDIRGFVGQQEALEEPEHGFDGLAVSLPIDKVNVSVGDWCICGGPYEFMVGFALETTKRLNDEFFYMNGYTNGCLLYFPTEDEFDYGGYEVYWSMLIYYLYMERVFPYDREAATKLIQFVVEKREKQMKLFGEE